MLDFKQEQTKRELQTTLVCELKNCGNNICGKCFCLGGVPAYFCLWHTYLISKSNENPDMHILRQRYANGTVVYSLVLHCSVFSVPV